MGVCTILLLIIKVLIFVGLPIFINIYDTKCLELFLKMFAAILTSLANASNHTKFLSFSNQKCEIQPTLISLHPNVHSQKLHYYPFAIKSDRCVGSCNTLNDLSNKVCVPNKTEDLNLSVFNMITGINESKTLTKHISCECKCKFDGRKCNSIKRGIMINVDVNVKNITYVKTIIFGILLHVITKMVKI